MYPKCSLNSYSSYLQIFGLLVLVIILIIVGIYYMQVYHENILEKYADDTMYLDLSPKEDKTNTAQPGNRSTYPLNKYPGAELGKDNKNEYKLRDCKVYFTNDIANCDNQANNDNAPKTCSYTFDGWQEFDTYTDKDGQKIQYPKKIFNKDQSNTNDLVNSYFTSKCFKMFNNNGIGRPQPFEYSENDLIKFDSKGVQSNTEKDTNRFGGKKYTSIQFLSSENPSDNFNNLIDSICSVKHLNKYSSLVTKEFYKFILNTDNSISSIQKVKLDNEQTNFETITENAILDFAKSGQRGLRIKKVADGNNTKYNLEVFIKSDEIKKPIKIYKFIYATNLCIKSKIKNYTTRESTLTISNFVKFYGCVPASVTGARTPTKETGITITALTNTDMEPFTTENVDYTQSIINLIDRKKLERIGELTKASEAVRNEIQAKINGLIAKQQAKELEANNYIPEDKTFLGIINLKKTSGITTQPIFDYKQGYINTIIEKIDVPIDSFIDSTTFEFRYIGNSSQKEYIFKVPEGSIYICETLVVGGGGGGGSRHGGGGGGGAVIYTNNVELKPGDYKILVGSGGRGAQNMGEGSKGADSSIISMKDPNNPIFLAKGGGSGNHYSSTGNNNRDGGSGGGGGNNKGNAVSTNIPAGKYGNISGECSTGTQEEWGGGGGGGAGGPGKNSEIKDGVGSNDGITVFTGQNYTGSSSRRGVGSYDMYGSPGMGIPNDTLNSLRIPAGYSVTLYYHGNFNSPSSFRLTQDTPVLPSGWGNQTSGFKVEKISTAAAAAGDGGDGISKTIAGKTLLLGAGGGGGCFINSKSNGKGGNGGGGDGSMGSKKAKDGKPMSGSGGGGGGFDNNNGIGGDGGSGIVIINLLEDKNKQKGKIIYDDLYKLVPPDNQKITIPSNELQLGCITSFIYLEKGYYRFRADIGDGGDSKKYGNPNIHYGYLSIYDESTMKLLKIFTYINSDGSKKPAYLKSYLNIETNQFYKLFYVYAATNLTNLPFKLWCKYSKTQPTLELTYIGYSNDIISTPSIRSIPIGQRDKYMIFTRGTYIITVPNEGINCDILLVGGGGGGGNYGGGGGGGGVTEKTLTLNPGNYSVTVGAGGAGGINRYNSGGNGETSSITTTASGTGFLGLYGAGGGGGGAYNQPPNTTPTAGSTQAGNFSSGGGGGGGSGGIGGGNNGGTGNSVSGNGGSNGGQNRGGGGGGAVGGGASATGGGAGNGGAGKLSTITGSQLYFGGGGGGGSWTIGSGTAGIGGIGGGGKGAVESSGSLPSQGESGNIGEGGSGGTGGGGGGGGGWTGSVNNQDGANGASGIVIIRYRTITESISIPSSLKITESYKIDNLDNSSFMYETERLFEINTEMNSYLFSGNKAKSANDAENNSVYQHYNSPPMREIFSTINYKNDDSSTIDTWKKFQGLRYYLIGINFFGISNWDTEIKIENANLITATSSLNGNISSDKTMIDLITLSTNIKNIDYDTLIGKADACLKTESSDVNRFIDKIGFIDTDKTYDKIKIEDITILPMDLLTPNLVSSIYIEAT